MIKNHYYHYILKYYDPNKDYAQRDFSANNESLTTTNTTHGPRALSNVTPG